MILVEKPYRLARTNPSALQINLIENVPNQKPNTESSHAWNCPKHFTQDHLMKGNILMLEWLRFARPQGDH
jgi:hypothetical protein